MSDLVGHPEDRLSHVTAHITTTGEISCISQPLHLVSRVVPLIANIHHHIDGQENK